MSSAVADGGVTSLLAPAHEIVDYLISAPLDLWSQDLLLDSWRELERLRNRLAAVEHRFVAEVDRRNLPAELGAKNTAAFVRGLLRVDPHDASSRVRAADAAIGRTLLTGEQAPAPFPAVAAAQASGSISPKHAAVIVRAVEGLADELQVEHGETVETDLVDLATQFDPGQLGRLANRMTFLLDQDGALADVAYRERRRELTLHQRADGSSTVTGEATAELTERLLTMFDALAKPKPETDGVKDPRTAGQRRHDAILDALDLMTRAELLPDAGGITTTVLLTTTTSEWESGQGVATTGHGAILPVREAIRIAGGDARIMTIEMDAFGAITAWTDARRCYTECQRLQLIARDGGCSFPGCDAPPAWCQAAHIVAWIDGGPTTVDNGTLLCGFHHRMYEKLGWQVISCNGVPVWIPPPWIDPDQVPRRNTHHEHGVEPISRRGRRG